MMPFYPVVIMGVSGSGKSVVGEAIASALGATFFEGDAYHPPANVDKMRQGIPLQDSDRSGWLETLHREIVSCYTQRKSFVMSCSALKLSYRDKLRAGAPGLMFVYLHAPKEILLERLGTRVGHYMPASLLDSQLATLEAPRQGELIYTIDATAPLDKVIETCITHITHTNEI